MKIKNVEETQTNMLPRATVQDHIELSQQRLENPPDVNRDSSPSDEEKSSVESVDLTKENEEVLTISSLAGQFAGRCPAHLKLEFIPLFLTSLAEHLGNFELDKWASLDFDAFDASSSVGGSKTRNRPNFSAVCEILLAQIPLAFPHIDPSKYPKAANFRSGKGFISWFKQTAKGKPKEQKQFAILLSGFITKLAYCVAGLDTDPSTIKKAVGNYIYEHALMARKLWDGYNYVLVLPHTEKLKVFQYALFDSKDADVVVPHVIGQQKSGEDKRATINKWMSGAESQIEPQISPVIEDQAQDSFDTRIDRRIFRIKMIDVTVAKHRELAESLLKEKDELNKEILNLQYQMKKSCNSQKMIERLREVIPCEDEDELSTITEALFESLPPLVDELKRSCTSLDKESIKAFFVSHFGQSTTEGTQCSGSTNGAAVTTQNCMVNEEPKEKEIDSLAPVDEADKNEQIKVKDSASVNEPAQKRACLDSTVTESEAEAETHCKTSSGKIILQGFGVLRKSAAQLSRGRNSRNRND